MSDPSNAPFQAPTPEDLSPLFPGYHIDSLIAAGGMGAVYRAVQLSLDRTVALKILPREFGADAAFRTSFEAEAKAMARLNHPNLIGVYDFGQASGMLYILMEFVPGKSLFHSAHGKAIEPSEAARIVSEVCHGLAHAHEAGILHRDIKPGNILLDSHAHPKIGDFGLARPIGRQVEDGEAIYGTPDYTAPEVIHAPHAVDARADIFSIGVVLHELLTGRLPSQDPRPPSTIAACDPRFDSIVRRATHPSPELRYPSATEMAADLAAIRTKPAAVAKLRTAAAPQPGPRPATVVAPSKSSSIPTAIAGIGVAAAVAFALFTIFGGPKSETPEPVVETPAPEESTPIAAAPEPAPATLPAPEEPPKPEPEIAQNEPEPPAEEPEPEEEKPIAEVVSTPTPATLPPVVPAFDVPAFLDRARNIMRQRATPIIDQHKAAIDANFDGFERKIQRAVRDLDAFRRPFAEPVAEARLAEWRANGNRVPATMDIGNREADRRGGGRMRDWDRGNEKFYDELDSIHAEFFPKQEALDQSREKQLTELAGIYIIGLQKEIERRLAAADEASAALLNTEISTTKDDPSHFPKLMERADFKTVSTEGD